jgi:quercetin dioxygenase-like cupin family protein
MTDHASSGRLDPILSEQTYKGTRFSVTRAEGATYEVGMRAFMEYRDLGLRKATNGKYDGKIVKARAGNKERASWHRHDLDFQVVFVLKGWITLEYEGIGRVTLRPGDCMHQAPGIAHIELDHSDDYEGIEITSPGRFETLDTPAPSKQTS